MLHGAVFLATCVATMTNAKHWKLQCGCHTFATCNAPAGMITGSSSRRHLEISCEVQKTRSDWLMRCYKIALQVTMDMSHATNCLAALRKVEDSFTFLSTRNITFCCIAGCKSVVLHVKSLLQLATQHLK